ncbi:MAG: HNH endonuclease [Pseudomonadota bacterium]
MIGQVVGQVIGGAVVNGRSTASAEPHKVADRATASGAEQVQQPDAQVLADPVENSGARPVGALFDDSALYDEILASPGWQEYFASNSGENSLAVQRAPLAHAAAVEKAHLERRGSVTFSSGQATDASALRTVEAQEAFRDAGWASTHFEMRVRWKAFDDWVGGLGTSISSDLQHDIEVRRAALVDNDAYVSELSAIADAEVGKVIFAGLGLGSSVGGFVGTGAAVLAAGGGWGTGAVLAVEADYAQSNVRGLLNGSFQAQSTGGGTIISLATDGRYGEGAYALGTLGVAGLAGGISLARSRISSTGRVAAEGAAALGPTGKQYSVAFEVKLDRNVWGRSDKVHFNRANAALDDALRSDKVFASRMESLMPGVQNSVARSGGRQNPAGWTWHHGSEPGSMQLVPTLQHTNPLFGDAFHPNGVGGYSLWAIPAGAPKRR